MKLYGMPGACSLAVHIALREAGLPFEFEEVDYRTRQIAGGGDYYKVNAKGTVPALLVEEGWLLTEVPVILQFVAARAPRAKLLPAGDERRRYRALEWLNFVATEIHKSFSPLFRPSTPEAFLAPGRAHLSKRLMIVESHLDRNRFLMGGDYCLADAYLFVVCRWLKDQDMALCDWPSLRRHFDETGERPAVRDALIAEGLVEPVQAPGF
ncbi:MAG TPA: glutathione transferase GstA [Afifellaceae bacterium]|nr:glutathione transferase GstA [Afifellaceae bacterium]